jgi:hypothetical protein
MTTQREMDNMNLCPEIRNCWLLRKRKNDLKVAMKNKEDIYPISRPNGMRLRGGKKTHERAKGKAVLRESQVSIRAW